MASVEFDGTTTKYASFTDAWTKAQESTSTNPATVKLLADVEIDSTLTVGSNNYITLDLNDKILKNTSAQAVITNEGNLTLVDNTLDEKKEIRYGQWNGDVYNVLTQSNELEGSFDTFMDGVITGGQGGVDNSGTFTMNGGTIAGNCGEAGVANNGGTFTMTSGKIVGNSDGGVNNGGTFNLSGEAKITNNKNGTGDDSAPRNVYLETDKVINISNGVNPAEFTGTAGVTMQTAGVFTDGWNGSSGTIPNLFTSDNSDYIIKKINGELALDTPDAIFYLTNTPETIKKADIATVWEAATNASSSSNRAIVELLKNVDLIDDLELSSGDYITLDLSGFVLKQTTAEESVIFNLGDLILQDSDTTTSNKLTINAKEITFNGGVITGGNGNSISGGAVNNAGTFTMQGGTLAGNNAVDGGAVYNGPSPTAKFNMQGGTITGNTANSTGGGVYNFSGTFTMNGGTISGNKATTKGGGLYNKVVFTMTNGTITGNTADFGGGVYNDNGTINLSGGANITGNVKGGAISGGVLYNGTANNIYMLAGHHIVISDNNDETSPDAFTGTAGVTLATAYTGAFTSGWNSADNTTTVHFTSDDSDYLVNANENELELIKPQAEVYFDDDTENVTQGTLATVWAKAQDESNSTNPATVTLLADVDLTSALFVYGDDYITLDLNGFVLKQTSANKSVISNSGDLTLKDSDPDNSNTIQIDSNDVVIKGGVITGAHKSSSSASVKGGGIYNEGTLTMIGGTIAGNTATTGGGVYNKASSTFTMNGGSIMFNTVTSQGGGVYNNANSTFTMTGGSIKENNSGNPAGGVYNGGTFNLSGDATITNNKKGTGETAYLSNVYLLTDQKITISDNDPSTNNDTFTGTAGVTMVATAGGVFTDGWDGLEYTTGVNFISDNANKIIKPNGNELEIADPDAEIYFGTDSTNVTKGTIDSVWAKAQDESKESNPATVTLLSDVEIDSTLTVVDDNYITLDLNGYVLKQTTYGQNVIHTSGNLTLIDSVPDKENTIYSETINGGVITGGNNSNGGGIYNSGILTMEAGTITGNTSTGNGGGVFNVDTFTMTGGTITRNTAATDGGGVYVRINSTFNLSGDANITGNVKGGMIMQNGLSGGTPYNIYLAKDKVITISDNNDETIYDAFAGTVGVTMQTAGVFTDGWNGSDDTIPDLFTSDNSDYIIKKINGELALDTPDAIFYLESDKATITKADIATVWEAATNASTSPTDRAIVELLKNVDLIDDLELSSGDYITLDLKGFVLKQTTAEKAVISNSGDLILQDSVTTTSNTLTINAKEITFNGGVITGGNGGNGGAVYNSGTFTMQGGTLAGNNASTDGGAVYNNKTSGKFYMQGGTISYNSAKCGGAVYNYQAGSFTMTAGTIENNSATNGGAVHNGVGTFTMTGGSIENNNAKHDTAICYGGAVYNGGTFTMTGGSIEKNSASKDGGAVYNYDTGTFTMKNGSIANGGATTATSGSIKENTSGGLGGGVCNAGTFNLSGDATITDNEVVSNEMGIVTTSINNIHVFQDNCINISDGTNPTAFTGKAGITIQSFDGGMFTSGWAESQSTDFAERFTSDKDSYVVGLIYDDFTDKYELEINKPVATVTFDGTTSDPMTMTSAWVLANDYATKSDKKATVKLTADANITRALSVADDNFITLDLNGYVLKQTTSGQSVIANSGNLIVQDSNPTKVNKILLGAQIVDITGGVITGGNGVDEGGAVHNSSGTLTMTGGTIAGNSTSDTGNGGGVFIEDGTFTMSGGTISNNTANNGGAVYVSGDGDKFTMNGTAQIKDNTAKRGGGVYVNNDTIFNMEAGTISGNETGEAGGAVYVDEDAIFNMEAGTISGNDAVEYGGGVYIYKSGTFKMNGGSIKYNSAADGGGVNIFMNSTFTMSGTAQIKENTADSDGGGVRNNGIFNLSGNANITGNVTGGTISDGVLTGGTASNIYVADNKYITISDGTNPAPFTGIVGINMNTAGVFTSGWTASQSTDFAKHFTSDSKDYLVLENGDELELGARPKYDITGEITADPALSSTATVKIMQNGIEIKSGAIEADGSYVLSDVFDGIYSIIVTDGDKVHTEQVIVNGADVVKKDISLVVNNSHNINTEIESSATIDITADNLDEMLDKTPTADTTIKLKVIDKTDVIESEKPDDKALIEAKANGKTVVSYLDITLNEITGSVETQIQPNGKLNVTIALPESVLADEGFTVIYAHDGKAKIIAPDYDADLHAISFSLTELSTYSIVYGKIAVSSGGSSIKTLDVDNDAPTIEKVGDNIVIEDKHLAEVTLNGKEVAINDNKAVINTKELENGEYTVYAVDKFRREATSTFTVENETATTPEPVTPPTPPTPTEEANTFPWWIIVLVVVLGAGAFIGYKKFKK